MESNDAFNLDAIKSAFPVEDFAMQCIEIEHQLIQLADYEASMEMTDSSAFATVALNGDKWLLLEPAVPGYQGIEFWMAPRQVQFERKQVSVKLLEIRCRVRLMSLDSEGEVFQIIEFGMEGLQAQDVVRKALRHIHKLLKIHLVALPREHEQRGGD